MKKLFVIMFLLVTALGFSQQKFALVIGNGNYTGNWGKLSNPINDASDMKAALESLGFKVDYIANGSLDQMQKAVINFKQKLITSSNSYGFFYYAGHGAQNREGQNFLIPVDADIPSLNMLIQRALPVQFVLDEMEEAKNDLNIIVLDACRNVPKSLDRSGTRGLAVVNAPKGSIVMYATAAGKTAADGEGRNGLFTSHLLKNLKTPNLSVTEVFMRTGNDVSIATNGDQFPETQYKFYQTAYLGGKPAPGTQPTPTPQPITNNMVRVEGGTFTMGSPANEKGRKNDEVQHQVTVSSFYMGKYEVTQKEYQEVMGTNPNEFKGDNLPVENVSWYDAVEYCNKRSRMEGLTPAYTMNKNQRDPNNYNYSEYEEWTVTWNKNANGYRLPTEAEWEYACRAGTTTAFSTGNNITTNQANYNGNEPYNNNAKGTYRGKTTAVGSFAPNAWGLYDMHGNVWEWCWDWYGDYSSGSQIDPDEPDFHSFRKVARGGGCSAPGPILRSAYRIDSRTSGYGFNYSSGGEDRIGFRLVRSN
jgi:formylglycine-generating enzyme required for sulfatase activity